MVLDYSRWDALEVSDDSDIECHPNVDKKSFIRAKQNQIHQQRHERRLEIKTLKYERIINDGLIERIGALLEVLETRWDHSKTLDEMIFQALIQSAGDPAKDEPPAPPEGVHNAQQDPMPRFSKMVGNLVDQVRKDLNGTVGSDQHEAFVDGVRAHLTKVKDLQQQLLTKLASLEKEESSKITSDTLRVGFDTSVVSKDDQSFKQQEGNTEHSNTAVAPREESGHGSPDRSDAGRIAHDVNAGDQDNDEDDIKISPLAEKFAQIQVGEYRACLDFISQHPEIVAEHQTNGLLAEAFNAQMQGKERYARQCVHQGLLLQYCSKLGRDGVGMFFKRITTKDHRAAKLFMDDVKSTSQRIKTRTAELKHESGAAREDAENKGIEQIQLQSVNPDSEIQIIIPSPDSDDPNDRAARTIYDKFPQDFQEALQSGKLDQVNRILATMNVDEAEQVVQELGDSGMLSMERGLVDATTEEGRQKLKEIEQNGQEFQDSNPEVDKEPVDSEINDDGPQSKRT